ncbi:hypothetical protein V6N12_009168 [Hibiscus sabdariffa]|uniref:Uncharacterized protein n=1 Tax=Hibiscus sabdariffa TaxID=183260 RepID=A0ABR2C4V8_9ROSI
MMVHRGYYCEVMYLQSVIQAVLVENEINQVSRALAESTSVFENINHGMVAAKEISVKNMLKRIRVESGDEENCMICLEQLKVKMDVIGPGIATMGFWMTSPYGLATLFSNPNFLDENPNEKGRNGMEHGGSSSNIETMEEDDIYTKDGTVDYKGNPANKKKTGTWKACPYIIGNEACERLAYYGMSTNLVLYFKHQLNQQSAVATKNNQNWGGTCYITPLIGAFLADSYLGRYWTIACFSIIYIIGMTLLALSASVHGIKPRCYAKDNCNPTKTQSAMAFLALYLVALGTGGIKPCVSSYGADQFDDADEKEKKHKSSFFNWFYFSINIGALIAASVLVWVQTNKSWGWGFGIPAIAMAIAVCSFFLGTRLYRNQKPGGSPITRFCQVLLASISKYNVAVPDDKSLLYETADAGSNIQGSRKLEHTKNLSVTAKHGKAGWIPDNLNHGHVDYFFWLLAALSVVNFVVFLGIAKWYTYKTAVGTLSVHQKEVK